MKRFAVFLPLLVLALIGSPPAAPAQAAPRCFPEAGPAIADCIDGRIAAFWANEGGLPVFGYPIAPQSEQPVEGRALQAQAFERNRLELHPENPAPYDVLLGRLGADALAAQGRDWQTFPKADPSAPHYFAATGHAIADQFWPYWSSHGLEFDRRPGKRFDESLALFGMPLSEAQVETNPTDGQPYLTQWFERARFEYHPANAGGQTVLLGLLQRELLQLGQPARPALAGAQPGGFVQPSGARLTRLGQPVTLKGVNYYPQWRPWSEMWRAWDGPQVERELRGARDQLGINALRVLLPYNYTGKHGDEGKIPPELNTRLHEIVQIAGILDMRVLITLFDFYHDFPAAGSASEAANVRYLRQLIPEFANDERVFAWDLHNEPDHYEDWRNGDAQAVLSWLGRMADQVHALAPHQLVTVGMGQASDLWVPGPDGRRAIDYSDVVSMHTYDAGTAARDLDALRAQTGKPILLEEFGWPTGPACVENYTEATQAGLYQTVLGAASGRTAGVFAWSLRDYDAPRTVRWDSREEYFGLYRADGSLKPAAQAFRALAAPPLPSATTSSLPLTTVNPHFPDDDRSAVLIPGSGHYVKGEFRRAWELFGGQATFGLPLTEAFKRPSDGVVVQYFQNIALEYRADRDRGPRGTSQAEQLKRILQPVALGTAYAQGRNFAPAGGPSGAFLDFYQQNEGAWRLGAPISGELTETLGGAPARVQYFERGRLEQNLQTGAVSFGALGAWAWEAQCRAAG